MPDTITADSGSPAPAAPVKAKRAPVEIPKIPICPYCTKNAPNPGQQMPVVPDTKGIHTCAACRMEKL